MPAAHIDTVRDFMVRSLSPPFRPDAAAHADATYGAALDTPPYACTIRSTTPLSLCALTSSGVVYARRGLPTQAQTGTAREPCYMNSRPSVRKLPIPRASISRPAFPSISTHNWTHARATAAASPLASLSLESSIVPSVAPAAPTISTNRTPVPSAYAAHSPRNATVRYGTLQRASAPLCARETLWHTRCAGACARIRAHRAWDAGELGAQRVRHAPMPAPELRNREPLATGSRLGRRRGDVWRALRRNIAVYLPIIIGGSDALHPALRAYRLNPPPRRGRSYDGPLSAGSEVAQKYNT
ncbi:hypothetical protein HYPSUDRAFT_209152 [Hypholoma sublateritium FD-334 SS-4]|uniref:Uncharacterized protein n=1 Tax=Hypholoma sublateritium (strain FD-334 SS-4) TaxID=945553 RepID=A0A0D2LST9_HYPSF|nr:hypothetical protein HYPSUDRAFT_209152 [Hypholoma sublateritium FD-334 SS-4]